MKNSLIYQDLMSYAGRHKILTYLSWILSVISALLALVPSGTYGVSSTTYWKCLPTFHGHTVLLIMAGRQ